MSSLKRVAVLACVVLAALAFVWFTPRSQKGIVKTAPLKPMRAQAQGATLAPVSASGAVSPTRATWMSYKQNFHSATDYWALAQAILPAAKAGDRDAQFYLFQIDSDCRAPYSSFIAPRGTLVSLDEALQLAAPAGVNPEDVKTFYSHCSRFYANDPSELGNPRDWLEKATEAGQPIAQATTAELRLVQDKEKLMVKAGVPPMGDALLPPIGGDADPRELIRMAVESHDPEVLFLVAEDQTLLHPTVSAEQLSLDRVAWLYVACQRGLDCSNYGDPIQLPCAASSADCGPVPARLMRMAKNNWAPVQERAQEINAKLDAGQWEELGLGTAPVPATNE